MRNIAESCESVSKVLPRFLRNIAPCCESASKVLRKCCKSVAKVLQKCCTSVATKCCKKACLLRVLFFEVCLHNWYFSEVLILFFLFFFCNDTCVFCVFVCFCHVFDFCLLFCLLLIFCPFFFGGKIFSAKDMTRERISLPDPLRERNRQNSVTT